MAKTNQSSFIYWKNHNPVAKNNSIIICGEDEKKSMEIANKIYNKMFEYSKPTIDKKNISYYRIINIGELADKLWASSYLQTRIPESQTSKEDIEKGNVIKYDAYIRNQISKKMNEFNQKYKGFDPMRTNPKAVFAKCDNNTIQMLKYLFSNEMMNKYNQSKWKGYFYASNLEKVNQKFGMKLEVNDLNAIYSNQDLYKKYIDFYQKILDKIGNKNITDMLNTPINERSIDYIMYQSGIVLYDGPRNELNTLLAKVHMNRTIDGVKRKYAGDFYKVDYEEFSDFETKMASQIAYSQFKTELINILKKCMTKPYIMVIPPDCTNIDSSCLKISDEKIEELKDDYELRDEIFESAQKNQKDIRKRLAATLDSTPNKIIVDSEKKMPPHYYKMIKDIINDKTNVDDFIDKYCSEKFTKFYKEYEKSEQKKDKKKDVSEEIPDPSIADEILHDEDIEFEIPDVTPEMFAANDILNYNDYPVDDYNHNDDMFKDDYYSGTGNSPEYDAGMGALYGNTYDDHSYNDRTGDGYYNEDDWNL